MAEVSLAIKAADGGVHDKDATVPEDPGDERACHPDSNSSSSHEGDESDESDEPEPPALHQKLLAIAEAGQTTNLATLEEFNSLLVEKRSEINAQDSTGKTALHVAIEHGLDVEAQTLIQNEADIGIGDNEGQQPLYHACVEGNTELVKLLLSKSAIVNAASSNGDTPLAAACRNGHTEIVNILLDAKANTKTSDKEKWAPLHWASWENHGEIVKRLLDEDTSSINAIEMNENWTPLNAAAYRGHEEVVSLLLEKNADLYTPDSSNWTPLLTATRMQHPEIVRTILRHRTGWKKDYLEIRDSGRNTPLHVASDKGYYEIASQLISAGANCNATDSQGMTPLHLASFHNHSKIVALLLPETPVPVVDVDAKANDGRTSLHLASLQGNELIVKALLQGKASIDATDNSGMTPLHLASGANAEDRCLSDPDPVSPGPSGYDDPDWEKRNTEAKSGRHLSVVALLLRNEADSGIKAGNGETALHRAATIGDEGRINILLENMKSEDFSWEDWKDSPVKSALGGDDPQAAMESLLAKQEVKEAPFWKDGARIQIIKEVVKGAKPHALLGLLCREVPRYDEVLREGSEDWGPVQWVAHERLPDVLSNLINEFGNGENMFGFTQEGGRLDTDPEINSFDLGHMVRNIEGRIRKDVESDTGNFKILPMVVALRDILKDPPFAQISRTHKDEIRFKAPVPGSTHQEIIKEAEGTVVAFFKDKDESGRIRRNREIKEIIYGPGPTEVVGTAIKSLIDVTRTGSMRFNSTIYAKENLKLTWVHLPSTNMVWMNVRSFSPQDLLTTIMFNDRYCAPEHYEVRSFLRDSWIEVPDRESRSRMMRPQYVTRLVEEATDQTEGAHRGGTAGGEEKKKGSKTVEATVAGSRKDEQKVYDDWNSNAHQPAKRPHGFVPSSAIYMPYFTYSTHCDNWDDTQGTESRGLRKAHNHHEQLMRKYNGKDQQQHGSPTLDEWYYQFAQDNNDAKEDQKKRNKSQVVSKYLKENEDEGDALKRNQWTVVRVNQLWIWTISNDWIITATSSPFNNSPDTLVDEILSLLSKQAEYGGSGAQPVTAAELVPVIIDYCVGSYERRPNENKRISIGQTFSHYINRIGRDETALFDDFRAWSLDEHPPKKGEAKANRSSTFQNQLKTSNKHAAVQTQSQIISAAIDKEKSLYGDIKDVRDELNILKSVAQFQQIVQRGLAGKGVDESRFSSTYVVKDLQELDSVAERIQSASDVANRQATEATRQGKTVMTFTFATVLFVSLI
ncbi:hypothetical protein FOVSG1_010202 [Fusarium oxysporum f. sp. vasinfectum]